jgi:hypothetical protein
MKNKVYIYDWIYLSDIIKKKLKKYMYFSGKWTVNSYFFGLVESWDNFYVEFEFLFLFLFTKIMFDP